MSGPFAVVFTGSRDWSDGGIIKSFVLDLKSMHGELDVHVGDARGVDAFVRSTCSEFRIPCTVYRADWSKHGRAAGPIRNRAMLDAAQPDLVVAFPLNGSKGTYDCLNEAQRRGLIVRVIKGGR